MAAEHVACPSSAPRRAESRRLPARPRRVAHRHAQHTMFKSVSSPPEVAAPMSSSRKAPSSAWQPLACAPTTKRAKGRPPKVGG
eukprot:1651627-Alexandrium_andersonii.AAC.1